MRAGVDRPFFFAKEEYEKRIEIRSEENRKYVFDRPRRTSEAAQIEIEVIDLGCPR